jgi:hypothetical protein
MHMPFSYDKYSNFFLYPYSCASGLAHWAPPLLASYLGGTLRGGGGEWEGGGLVTPWCVGRGSYSTTSLSRGSGGNVYELQRGGDVYGLL